MTLFPNVNARDFFTHAFMPAEAPICKYEWLLIKHHIDYFQDLKYPLSNLKLYTFKYNGDP